MTAHVSVHAHRDDPAIAVGCFASSGRVVATVTLLGVDHCWVGDTEAEALELAIADLRAAAMRVALRLAAVDSTSDPSDTLNEEHAP